ncbi:MAG: hypothetical protein AAFR81_08495 [Chloroflexota bacterium]
MTKRLNNTLTSLADQYAPDLLIHAPPDGKQRIPYLADGLVRAGVLVMTADIPTNNYQLLLRRWVNGYGQLYNVLSTNLFTTVTGINLGTVDNMTPPVVVLKGEAVPVIDVLAGYVVPYVTFRQRTTTLSEAEIRGLITFMLEELEADDITMQVLNTISRTSGRVIKELVTLPIRQYSLTTMKKQLFHNTDMLPKPPTTTPQPAPEKKPKTQSKRPELPPGLPETGKLNSDILTGKKPVSPSDEEPTQPMPIWFDDEEDSGFQPPVPPVGSDLWDD